MVRSALIALVLVLAAPPAAEQHGCQGDFQLVNDTQVQVLLDHIRSTRDTNITTACGFPSQL